MSLLEWFALSILVYYILYAVLWLIFDCNVALWYKERFGLSISTLRGQVVWITGASSGIGKALAKNLARHGVRLVLSARRIPELEEVQKECLKEAQGLLAEKDVMVLPMDMLNLQKHKKCLNAILDHFGRLDILVNNAGRSQRANWEDIDIQVDRDLFELDVFSAINLSRVAVNYFLKEGGGKGHLACTSSVAGLATVPYSATYCAAKHALNSYMKTLKMEKRKLDVTVFAPGPIGTDFLLEAFTEDPNSKLGLTTKNQRRMTAERCGYLYAVSLANKMDLTWCGLFPVNFLAYASQSAILTKIFSLFMSEKTLSKIREGKL